MNSANSKTCAYLPKNPRRLSNKSSSFFARGTATGVRPFLPASRPAPPTLLAARSNAPFSGRTLTRTARLRPRKPSRGPASSTKKAQTIDPIQPNSFKSCPAKNPPSGYGAGTVKVWPACNRRGSSLELAAMSASTLTPYFRAITPGCFTCLDDMRPWGCCRCNR